MSDDHEAKQSIRRKLESKIAVYHVIVEENPKLLDILLTLQAKVFAKMLEKLQEQGFTREEAIELMKEGKPVLEVDV